jgi:hypothetical protein
MSTLPATASRSWRCRTVFAYAVNAWVCVGERVPAASTRSTYSGGYRRRSDRPLRQLIRADPPVQDQRVERLLHIWRRRVEFTRNRQ